MSSLKQIFPDVIPQKISFKIFWGEIYVNLKFCNFKQMVFKFKQFPIKICFSCLDFIGLISPHSSYLLYTNFM